MSPPEVLHRVREAGRKFTFRNDRQGWERFAGADGQLADLGFLRARLAAGAPACHDALAGLDAGSFAGLGQPFTLHGGAPDWFTDPVSNTRWPGAERYCFDVDVRSTGHGKGDVKFIWEINRLQFLHPLAARIAGAPENAMEIDRAFALLERWMADNPPFRGVNWFSGIELAMRMVSIALFVAAVPRDTLSDTRRQQIHRFVAAHAFWLERYPSRFSSANNHLVAEGLGLLISGLIAPGIPQAAAYEAEGRAILEEEAARQIFSDGVGGEQSPTYQAFTMEMLAFGAMLGEGLGRPMAPIVTERLAAGARFLQSMMDAAGSVPHVGDDDEGRVIAMPPDREPLYVASIVAAVAGICANRSLLPPDRDPHLRDALFAVPAGTAQAANGFSCFDQGGYSVARAELAGRQAVLTFDHGPLGYLSLAAHGHADALAIWLSLDERRIIADAGTYLYHSGGVLRNRLRSSAVHNTLTIEDSSQSIPSSAFSWSHKAKARLVAHTKTGDWSVTGSHDGYQKTHGVRHERRVAKEGEGFRIADHLAGATRELPVKIGFLLASDVGARIENDVVICHAGGEALLRIEPPKGFSATLVRGDAETGRGMISPRFGEILETVQVVLQGRLGSQPVDTRLVILPPG